MKPPSDSFRFVMMLLCVVFLVFDLMTRDWFVVPIWAFNFVLWYRMWRAGRRFRAQQVVWKLQEAAWRTPPRP